MKRILLFALLLCHTGIFAATRTAVTTGNWLNAATWGGTVPQPADIAVIPAGITVTLPLSTSNATTPWNNPATIQISGKLILQGSDPLFSNPCTIEVLNGGEFNDATVGNAYLLTQPSLLKVYSGAKCTAFGVATLVYNGNYSAEYQFPTEVMNGPFTIDVSGGNVTYIGSVLPLDLLSFTVKRSGEDHVLNWQTTNEINTESFFIERSSDGIIYQSIGNVPAATSGMNNNYSFTDRSVLRGYSFYRLKMVDIDGRFTYSSVVPIKKETSQDISVYPSPAKDRVNIITTIGGTVNIYNSQGRLVYSKQIMPGNTTVDVSQFSDGVYFIEQSGRKLSFIKASR